ncbi:hypothetical protein R9X47_29015 [Wukongibacter baidiensis]|uniref:hypothetical protein n=1 Tax=Wukongibacter baidiensis TaxID=1723361 RepID=UPI003D7F7C51
MKRKLIFVLVILLVASTISLNQGHLTTIYTSAIDSFNAINSSIPYSLIEQLDSSNIVKQKEAETELKKICLDILDYTNWQNYIDYINLETYKGNVLPGGSDELIVALNLSKDLATVCVFSDTGQNYSFAQKIENLLPIETIQFVKIPDKDYDFLVIHQIADERLGAFYYEKFLEIYMFEKNIFKEKLKETTFYEEIYKSVWIDESAPKDEWNKNTIKNNILFIENSDLYIDVSGTKNKYKAKGDNTIPKSNEFKIENSTSYKYRYFWNKEFEKFSRKEDVVTFNDVPVFVHSDSETDSKNLCGFSKNKYKLVTTSDKILYIDKEVIDEQQ